MPDNADGGAPGDGRGRSDRRPATARDVAALAGVALGTVSNVVNRPDKVAPSTLHRVEEAMTQLGWSRNQIAQQLRGGRSAAIGAVVVELSPHTVRLLDSIEADLSVAGVTLQITTSAHDRQRELDRIELFMEQRVRGILLSPVQSFYHLHLSRLSKLNIPLVLLGQHSATSDLCSVTGDDEAGGRLAVAHLVAGGHRRITAVGGRADNHHVRARLAGARSATPPAASLTVHPTDTYDVRAGTEAALTVAALPASERPTAVFAINDLIASGLMRGLTSAGFRIPADIAIVGYDDLPIAQTTAVPLTTIRNPDVAHRATSLLLEEIAAADSGTSHTHHQLRLTPELVVRDSTAGYTHETAAHGSTGGRYA
ncbi:MAG TPA: LacI family DNA-binding transcriptional regulator [Microlunatus sp.]